MQSKSPSTETLRHRQALLQSRSGPALPPPRQARCSQLLRHPQETLGSSRTLCQEIESCTQDILRLPVLCRNAERKASSEVETHQTAPEDRKAQQEPPQPGAERLVLLPCMPAPAIGHECNRCLQECMVRHLVSLHTLGLESSAAAHPPPPPPLCPAGGGGGKGAQ